jgi:diacylglycerol O-acyltransferase
MAKIKLNNVDLAWLRMDDSTNAMMITVAVMFKGQLNYERLITDLDGIAKRYRRLRQRIVLPVKRFTRPYWDDDPSFRVENHVERMALPLPADDIAVQELVNKQINMPLDFAHPLWKMTLVDNYPEGSILMIRIHHCIADGISLLQVLLQMTKTSLDAPAEQAYDRGIVQPTSSQETPGSNASVKVPTPIDMIAAIIRIIFRRPDPPTILKGPLGKVKKVSWSEPLSVPELKKIARNNKATLNDILMAVSTGAIRRYMDMHNDDRKRNIRAFILVNMRGRSFDDELGNKFGLVFLDLPLDRETLLERIDGVKEGMDFLKASAEYAATYFILNLLGLLPSWIEHLATRFLDTKGTIVATNVPGSRRELIMADAPIQSIIGWVPQTGRIGIGLSFLSYNEQLVVGLNVDAGVIPDPEKFMELFIEEYKVLQAAVIVDTVDVDTP